MKKHYFYIVGITTLLAGGAAFLLEPTGWLGFMCVAFLLSFALMYNAMHNILNISHRKQLFDLPDHRRIHKTPTSRLGGFAFAPIVICSVILVMTLHETTTPGNDISVEKFTIWICALTFIHMTGTIDDLIGIRNTVKLFSQIIASILVIYSGFWINDLHGLFGIHALPAVVGMPLTVLFMVFVINAFNLIDGMDGLAASLGILVFTVYSVYSYFEGLFFFSAISFSILGVLASFFHANMWGYGAKRHKLFMGDTGSQTIGLIAGILCIGLAVNSGTALAASDLALVLSPLLVPAFDVLHVVLFRLVDGRSPFNPDMTHIHHRLLKSGLDQHRSILLILFISVIFILLNLLLAPYINITLILLLDLVVWCFFNGVVLRFIPRKAVKAHKGRQLEQKSC